MHRSHRRGVISAVGVALAAAQLECRLPLSELPATRATLSGSAASASKGRPRVSSMRATPMHAYLHKSGLDQSLREFLIWMRLRSSEELLPGRKSSGLLVGKDCRQWMTDTTEWSREIGR